jgi:hypothetical protein
MPIKFKNADVEKQFESDFEKDPIVHVPADKDENRKSKNNGYKGPLSEISVDHAERLIRQESNLVRKKGPTPAGNSVVAKPPAS